MSLFSKKTIFEVLSEISTNLTAGWIGVLVVSPGFFQISVSEFKNLLTINFPLAIVGLYLSFVLKEIKNQYESK
jgi:hypothetical protein